MSRTRVIFASLALLTSAVVGVSPVAAFAQAVAEVDASYELLPGRLVVESRDEAHSQGGASERTFTPSEVVEELLADPVQPLAFGGAQQLSVDVSSGVRLCFDPATPEPVRAAVTRAGQMWSQALDIDGPIVEIDVMWIPFRNGSTLGAAGPSTFVIHQDLPSTTTRYPVALANELLNTDFLARQPCDMSRDGEVLVFLNSSAGGGSIWHLGEGRPPPGMVDLTSVAAHEMAHGLGFTGSAELTEAGQLAWPDDGGAPYTFDLSVSSCGGASSCSSASLQDIAVGNLGPLRSGALWFDAIGAPLQLHAPPTWEAGSSFSHLSDTAYPASSGLSLMTPYFEPGESHDRIDGAAMAVMQRIGWSAATTPSTTAAISVTPLDSAVRVTLSESDLSAGSPPTSHIVRIERETVVDGISTFELAFEPLEITDSSTTINGLNNDEFYRLVVQGKNDNGLGPQVFSVVFTPGSNPASPEAVDLARRVFVDLREKPADPIDVAQLARSIDTNGAGPAVATLLERPEFADHQAIVRLYLGFLDRTPDAGGIEFWIDQRREGQDLTLIATRFAAASSFELGANLSDQGFVERVYETILDRPAELEGLAFWVGRLNTGTPRGRLLVEISESVEHRAANGPRSQVIAAYVTLADRVPTTAEVDEGTALIAAGQFATVIERALND